MAIFKKSKPAASTKSRDRTTVPARAAPADATISIIGSGMSVVGDITTEGIIRIEGQVLGTIRAGKSVILGPAGRIEGDIVTDDAVIGGTVNGSIDATGRVELQSTSRVTGEIRTSAENLKLEEGGRFSGHIEMLEEEALSPHKPAALPPGERIRTTPAVTSAVSTAPPISISSEDRELRSGTASIVTDKRTGEVGSDPTEAANSKELNEDDEVSGALRVAK